MLSKKKESENKLSETVSKKSNTFQYFKSKNNNKAWTKTHTVEKGLYYNNTESSGHAYDTESSGHDYDTESCGHDYDTEPNSNTDYSGYETKTESDVQYETESEGDNANRNKKEYYSKTNEAKTEADAENLTTDYQTDKHTHQTLVNTSCSCSLIINFSKVASQVTSTRPL